MNSNYPKLHPSPIARKLFTGKKTNISSGTTGCTLRSSSTESADEPNLRVKKTIAVVIDTGTGSCKAGFAGQAQPSFLLPTSIGYPLEKTLRSYNIREPLYVGKAALEEEYLRFIEPVYHGIITDWEAVETLWRHLYYHDLKVPLEEHALLLSDPPLSPTTNREKMVEVVFESMNCPGMYIAYQSVLSTYFYGLTGGLVVETGYGVTHTVPVHEGYILHHATERLDIAGTDLNNHLMKLFHRSNNVFSEKDRDIIEDIKLKSCYVALDIQHEMQLPEKDYMLEYHLPDGQILTIGKERFMCPEALFQPPHVAGIQPNGIHQMALKSLKKVPEESKRNIHENILICGGSSKFEGFTERFSKEIFLHNYKPNILSADERKYSTWIGGSILASLNSFQSCWIRLEEYKEYGPLIVYRKCF
ncbi:actin-2-like [Mixophyes fleayi]|uniref:actin-2-like n=1 Tax=Mixophyes fleayi TaxID=3061075 RepID=UPI003F4E08AD